MKLQSDKLTLYQQLSENGPRSPLKDNQTANVLPFRRRSEESRRGRGLETALSANWISPLEMTLAKKWNVILAQAAEMQNMWMWRASLTLLTVRRCVRHKSSDANTLMVSRTAVFRVCVAALTLRGLMTSCGAAAPPTQTTVHTTDPQSRSD